MSYRFYQNWCLENQVISTPECRLQLDRALALFQNLNMHCVSDNISPIPTGNTSIEWMILLLILDVIVKVENGRWLNTCINNTERRLSHFATHSRLIQYKILYPLSEPFWDSENKLLFSFCAHLVRFGATIIIKIGAWDVDEDVQ